MNRSNFIKNIIAAFGASALPAHLITNYQKIYLLQCFIRGFRFYKGQSLLPDMKIGNLLELVREPQNPHDDCAIALHFNCEKIGYLPMESNEVLSRLIDADVIPIQAEITHLQKAAQTWENVSIAIYILKPDDEPILTNQAYLTQLDTPNYYSIKYANNHIGRVYYENDDDENYDYEAFKKTHQNGLHQN